ncbi:TonB-dependent receptor P3 [Neolewinella maritima]|uniref:TonB-dependent receptor P3 n=1 Tax=Neolewinella maritima TaxID=1383882 RepID=A0ABM9AZS6_9BACT|nr:SusC/RagA family TonB-linked outer membrane protein [Neolewinella maritima]CAH0999877.1 TonB-dependent receptor P3 [Neolewinella maritima]
MDRFRLLLVVLLLGGLTALQAQGITGTISDGDGVPLIGASILVDGTTSGTVTDIDGNFTLEVPANTETMTISYTGFETMSVPVIVGQKVYDITMLEGSTSLDEVVVTAQGIERQKRELGYSVATISGDEVGTVRETNVVNSLQGKVSGVQISQQSGNLGGSTKILIRGVNSLSGNNNPLWVVDGVPIFDNNVTTGSQITGGFDTGNRAQDINPDDIESISVLKGANAAALYGSRAANGAIIVTTKKGGKGNRANITFNSTYRADTPLRLPDFQNEYAQGTNGRYDLDNLNGWGPRIEGQQVENLGGETVALQAYPDNVKDFYETGSTLINNLAIGGGSEKSNYRFSATALNQEGIFPGSELDRITLGLNAGQKFDQKISSSFGINLVRTTSGGRVAQGGNDPNVLVPIINGFPRNLDLNQIRNYIDESSGVGEQLNSLSETTNNPYWVALENQFNTEVDRVFGNFALTYEPLFWLSFTGRLGVDFIADNRFRSNRKGTLGRVQGDFTDDRIEQRQLDYNFLATAGNNLTDDIFVKAIVGFNYNTRVFERLQNQAVNLTVDQLFSTGNAEVNNVSNSFSERRLFGVYGDITFTFRDYLSLNLTGRNDFSSTLPLDNNSYFYPSAGLSFIFTDALKIDDGILSFGKIRTSYAEVGGDTNPYQLAFNYFPQTTAFGQFGTGTSFPFDGRLAFSGPGTIPPEALRPESVQSFEIGTELQFFNGRFGLDFTYYNVTTEDQILAVPIPESTGFSFQRLNVGETSNKGFEITLNLTPIKTEAFTYNSLITFTRNRFVVEALSPGTDRLVINSGFNSLQIVAEPGESFGLYANTFQRVEADSSLALADQRVLVSSETGLRSAGDNERIGDVFPDFIAGWTNNMTFKGVNLRFTFDYRQGGLLFSNTVADLRSSGLAAETAIGRDGSFIDRGAFIEEADGTVRPNDIPVTAQAFWQNYSDGGITEYSIFDASFIKLREIALNYTIPSSVLSKVPFQTITLGVEARNLAILYSEIPHIDPETNLFGSASDGAGIEFNSPPTTRTFGVNLRLGF